MTSAQDKRSTLMGDRLQLSEPPDYNRKDATVPQPEAFAAFQPPEKKDLKEGGSNTETSLLERFAEETSAHGCARVNSASRGKVWKCLWALSVVTSLGGMIFTLYSMLQAYDQYPFNTVTKVTIKPDLPFPGVTLCNSNEVDTSLIPVNSKAFSETKIAMFFGLAVNETDPETQLVLNSPIDSLVNSSWIMPGQGLDSCFFNNQAVNCSDFFSPVQGSSTRCVTLNTQHRSLRSMKKVGPLCGLRLSLNVHQLGYVYAKSIAAAMKLYIHEPNAPADLHSSGVMLSPGFSHYVGVRQVHYTFLPEPYMALGKEACVDVMDPSFSRPLRLNHKYSFHVCMQECAVDLVADMCSCRGVLNAENSSLPMCTMLQFYTCYDSILSDVYFNVTTDMCGCSRPCDYTEYLTQISSAYYPSDVAVSILGFLGMTEDWRKNFMEVYIYLDKLLLEEVVHEPVYTYTSVMGTIGGQMGFFLGASILTVAEVVELLICILFRFLRRICGPKQSMVHSRVIPVQDK